MFLAVTVAEEILTMLTKYNQHGHACQYLQWIERTILGCEPSISIKTAYLPKVCTSSSLL